MNETRVLFLHGLEGRPDGTKAKALRAAGFEVHAADMHMSTRSLRKKNSIARQLLRLPEPWLVASAGLLGLASGLRRRSPLRAAAAVALPVGWIAARRGALLAEATGLALDACVAIQREALSVFRPHVVVGSSWGGAVAVELLLEGAWAGPTVLLAPAFAKVRRLSRRGRVAEASGDLRALAARAPITIVHDPSDDVIPHLDSVRLSAGSAIALRSVDGGGHRLLGYVERGELAEDVREVRG